MRERNGGADGDGDAGAFDQADFFSEENEREDDGDERLDRGGEGRHDCSLAVVAVGGEGGDDAEAVERAGGEAGPDHRGGHIPVELLKEDDADGDRNEGGAPCEVGELGGDVVGGDLLRGAENAPADHRAEGVEHPRREADAADDREGVAKVFSFAAEEDDGDDGEQDAAGLDEIEAFIEPEVGDEDRDERIDVGQRDGDGGLGAGLKGEVEADVAGGGDQAGDEASEKAEGFGIWPAPR